MRGPYGKLWTEFFPSFYGPSAKRAGHENKEGKNEDLDSTRFWTANSVKYENIIIDANKRNTSDLELQKGKTKVGKQGVRSLYLFKISK